MRLSMLCLGLSIGSAGMAAPTPVPPEIAAWAFPVAGPAAPAAPADDVQKLAVPGALAKYTEAQLHDLQHAIDWFPDRHPRMPAAVAAGQKPGVFACGYCHSPTGWGRPENASLAGLKPGYITQQVAAFADGSRRAAVPDYRPTALMAMTAHQISAADVQAAAAYFSKLRFTSHVRIVETANVAAPRAARYILIPDGAPEPIGDRIIETPDDMQRFERRDPNVTYTAYVPPGSLARGAAVAKAIGCANCHGQGMKLWGAGRSPSYIFRQLTAFKSGARTDAESPPMQAVAKQLSLQDMISVAAYWGSLKP